MKALLVSAATIGLLAATPAFAQAGPLVPGTGTADATIVSPITVQQVAGGGMNFGKIAAIAGSVTIDPDAADGAFTESPGMVVDATGIKAASFVVGGQSGLAYTPTLAAPNAVISNGTGSMVVALDLSTAPSGGWVVGTDNFRVGGTLNVNNGQSTGAYTGSFTVNVQYN